jgi:hypothetical protein
LEVSRKLKDLGILQESCFYWVLDNDDEWSVWGYPLVDIYEQNTNHLNFKEKVSAFTCTELGVMWSCPGSIAMTYKEITCPDEFSKTMIRYNEGKRNWIDRLNQNLEKWRGE